MSTRIRTLNFLPEVFQTKINAQFLAATLDQIVAQPETKRIEGYVGSKIGYGINAKDYYVTEPTKVRTDYQLEPGVVFKKTNENVAKDFISYPGMLDAIKLQGGITNNNDRLFNSEFYSWDSFTNLDKIINFNQYYWIPEGPENVVVTNETVYYANDYNVFNQPNGYNIVPVTSDVNTGSTNPTLTLLRGGTYTFAVNQTSEFWIQGEPGVTGYSLTQPNVQTREILGVDNNGASQGIVTFTVPPKDAQSEYNFPGNNLVDVVSTVPFEQINGALVSTLTNGIDGVTSLNGLTVMFYNTGIPSEVGYVSNFFDYTPYDQNNDLTALETITITATNTSNEITCNSTANLTPGNSIIFTGTPIGLIAQYSETLPNTIYYVHSVINSTTFRITTTPGGSVYTLTNASGTMTGIINQGEYEQGYYTNVNEHFYRITYVGDPSNPVIRLTEQIEIPINQKITAVYGTQWITRNFYRNNFGFINLIPYLSAQLDTLYYQDGTSSNKVGIIRLIESNITNVLNVDEDIIGKPQYTSTNGVIFTNGLKISFQGDVLPRSYLSGEYYVEGVGTAIELLPVTDFISPEDFTANTYIPWDVLGWDTTAWEGNSYIPVTPDYITISRNAIDKNAWSRSNRWFHIDVINATAFYNNNPSLITLYSSTEYKAKRPIIEFYPNLKLFNSGVEGKSPVDFIDNRTTDAFSLVAGKQNYYPDVEVYTAYTGTIASTNYTATREIISGNSTTGIFTTNTGFNTTGFRVNDLIIFDSITPGSGLTPGGSYYVAEIISSTQFKLSSTKNGSVVIPNITVTGPYQFSWSPQSTTITIADADIVGTFTIGQYVADSTDVIPRNAQIIDISGTTTLTITVDWDEGSQYFTTQTNSSIVGSDTTVDNYALFEGARVVFTMDTNENVKNKIYVTRFSVTSGTTPVITLTEAPDGDVFVNQQTVALRGYFNQGKEFWFDGVEWIDGQQKIDINQPPLFDVFDKNNISFGDSVVYTGTSFTGCKLFSYGIGSGLDDKILGFPIRYSSVDNVGDISFDVSINKDTFNYVQGVDPVTQKVNTGYIFQHIDRERYTRQLGWQTAVSPSTQYQIFSFNFDPLTPTNTFVCDVAKVPNANTNWPTIKVFINNRILNNNEYTVNVGPDSTTVTLLSDPIVETVIQITLLSDQVSKIGFYQTPINLNNNPLNEDLTVVNVGDIRGQYQSMFFNNPNTTGEVFGPNNFRDLGNMVPWGDRIIQNSASLALPGAFLRKQEHNLFNALIYNSKEYVKFKNLLVYTIQNNDYAQRYTPSEMLDDALDQITASKNDTQSFFWSDMIPNKAPYVTNTYSFANSLDVSIYPLTRVYDFKQANYYGVLVYLTRTTNNITKTTQLIINNDYNISIDSPSLTISTDLLPGDIITIKEYNQTYGSYVPNTPTKLGLYPSFVPSVVLDSAYTTPTYFIKGHDGSYNKLYGNYDPINQILDDFRDQVLLEFELRVYNNLKLDAVIPISEYEIVPGYFRTNDYSNEEWLAIYSTEFLNWVGQNRLNYKTQYYNTNDNFTYNYYQSGNAIDKSVIFQGYWRGIYQFYYDTTTPHVTPWEMLGFTTMPTWWITRYGPAPYTSDNLVLWNDLAAGLIWNNGNSYINPLYERPGLLEILPVDSAGNLLPPIDSVVGSYKQKLFQRDWKIGDVAPVEFSYRRSSTFPFDLVRLFALMKPARFYNLAVNLDIYKYNFEFNQYLVNNRSHLTLKDIQIYGNGTAVTSYINWIIDYEKQVGIDATQNIRVMLDNLDVRLVYRLAGFSDKRLLKFYVEKGSPNSKNASLLIPDESYSVLLYDNQPFNKVVYSGVIVQKTDQGYTVYGNSQNFAYFKTLKPKFGGNYEFIEVEDLKVKVAPEHFDIEQYIPYNTTFYTVQEVSQFLMDYGAYLITVGMKFEDQLNELQINWQQMIAEFLYWSQLGWSAGSIVTLNPAAKKLTIDKDSNIVQPLTIQQQNFVLNQNLYPIQIKDLCIDRQNTAFNIETLNEGDTIAYGQFNLSNFEHGIVFDNITVFGDIIYNLITGLRQNRIILKGTKSADWNGTVNAAGFIYNQNNISEWDKTKVYTKGEIVTFKNKYWVSTKIIQPSEVFKEEDWKRSDYDEIQKGLLPNSSTRSYESTLYYDVNTSNLENDADLLGFSLIGYRPRDYMALADLSDITQVNVYKNMIKDKGTLNAASAFRGAQLPQGGIDYEIYENWAIQAGEFGGILNNNFIDFKINQKYLTANPSVVGLTNGVHNEGVDQEIPIYSLYNYGRPITSVDVLATVPSTEPSTLYPDAGYVNYNDVKMSAFYYAQMPFAANKNGVVIPIQQFYVRDYVWLANYLERWQVFTPVSMGQVTSILNNLNDTITINFNKAHNLSQFEPFAIVNFDVAIDGYYNVAVVVDDYRVLVTKILDPAIKEIFGQGIALRFQSQRVATPADIESLPLLDSEFRKNTVWVDTNTDGGWGVYQKRINYNLQNQITKSTSQSLGSAVAIGDRLGYLIGDADDGKVYRYTYNDLSEQFVLVQQLTGNAGFGSTISYSGDVYAIVQPTGAGRCVKLYQLQNTNVSDDLILIQTINNVTGATTWGTAVEFSGDQNWIYISDIDNNTVHLYLKSTTPTTAGYFTIGDTYTITSVGTTDFTALGATSNDVGVMFIATGAGTGTGTAANSTYRNVTSIDGDALGLTSAGDKFGYSIATDYAGDCVVIGAPYKDYNGLENWGYAYVFDRVEQNIEVQNSVTPATYPLIWTPTSLTASVTATNSTTDRITLNTALDAVEDLNKPVMFVGSGLTGTNIVEYQIYYIASISSFDITIKETRESASVIQLNTVGSISSTYAYVQTEQLNVYKNGTLVTDNNYAALSNNLVYVGEITPGDIITVSGYEIVLIQTLTTQENPQIGAQFGISLDTNTHASEIIIGAPFQLNSQIQEGSVYRFTDASAKYGVITGITDCNVTTTRKILINGFLVSITAGNAENAAELIRNSNITNVTATAVDGKLVISLINTELAPINQKLFLNFDSTTTISELGFQIFVQTQEILCPHPYGPTQFGTVVKFNEYDSFIASAPVGTRYTATTFDFTDDESQDNDTIFDNNATQFVDESPNFGAVYMFDYVSQYDANIQNTGKFIYAQSVNSPNLVYSPFNTYNQDSDTTVSNQPRYGTALDFNGYNVIVGTPGDIGSTTGTTYAGSATVYNNPYRIRDWLLYRQSAPVVDINKISNIQLFSAETNNTLVNLDYIDPLQGKILGAARENIDYISNNDPATYNNASTAPRGLVWGAAHIGKIWLNTKNMRYVNYHQNNDVSYNAEYWGTLFPGSDVAVYSWVSSNVIPSSYNGPGIPFNESSYSIQYVINEAGALTPIYYFWARDTNTIFTDNDKTLADSVIASYILAPKASGISYMAPILPNVFGLYNTQPYYNANDTVLHLGYATGSGRQIAHTEFDLIRDGNPNDFLPGIPLFTNIEPDSLYNKLLDSLSGVDETGGVVPDPYLPKAVQSGVLSRPRQSFFYNRFIGLKNYLQYANAILAQYPIVEIRQSTFLNSSGLFYDTQNYWEYINWWAPGYDNNVKSALQVLIYADLSTLSVPAGTIVSVAANANGRQETYIYTNEGVWSRIGLQNGTIRFKSSLWDYESVRLGYGDNFFDTDLYDIYPSEETRKIVRALNEEIYIDDLLIYRNESLILLFKYIQSEASENQNYLPWLNKTSFIDVSHTIRELRPIEVYQTDNQEFLSGYLNEIKPYHVVIKEFVFKYTGSEPYLGNITDFDLPAQYNNSVKQFITPQLVYADPNSSAQYLPSDPIWQQPQYTEWRQNYGVSLTGENEVQITTLASYISLNTSSFSVNNAQGFPINGIIKIDNELIGYSTVDRALNVLTGLTRGVNGTTITAHIPGALIFIDLPAVLLLDAGRAYVEPPKVTAYIDTSIYPEPIRPAQLVAVMGLDSLIRIDTIDPGEGYAVLPTIKIDPSVVVPFASSAVNLSSNTIELFAPLLQTGDMVQYIVGADTTPIGGLQNNQWYYINVLETVPSVVVGFYSNYADAELNHDRIKLYTSGSGDNHQLNLGARASAISTSYPIRENDVTLRFDRTTYNSDVIDWRSGLFYGSYFAGELNNRESVSSSSITLQSTQPPIDSILASAQGVTFEITDVRNDRVVTYSSFIRRVLSTETTDDSVRLILQDDGSGNPNASGGTNGFYVGMPVKFVGAVGSSGIVNEQVYYVNSILNQTDFTLSTDPSGSPIVPLNDWTISIAGLECYVGQVSDTAIVTINYPGIRNITATEAITNKITIPLNSSGTGGTHGFYIDIPIFFTGTNNTLPQNGVFGGIVENEVYYVTTIVDDQTFTMSKNTNPQTLNVVSTVAATDVIVIETENGDTSRLSINEPVIFNTMIIAGTSVTNFGNLISGSVYYISSIVSLNSFTVSTEINGSTFALTNVSVASNTSALVTSQKDTYTLTTDAASTMVVNINLPVSPGQINGQQIGFYETSEIFPNISGNDTSLINREIAALIGNRVVPALDLETGVTYTILTVGTTDFTLVGAASNTPGVTFVATGAGIGTGTVTYAVNKVVLTNFNAGDVVALWLTNIYVNMPIEVSSTLGASFLTAGTTYYVVEKDIIEVTVISTSSTGNTLRCASTASLFVDMPILFSGSGMGGVEIDVEYWVKEIIDNERFVITNTPGGSAIVVSNATGSMTGTGLPYVKLSTTLAGSPVDPGDTQQSAAITAANPAVITVAEAPVDGTEIIFRNGTIPSGLAFNTTYYVRNATSTTFNVSLTPTSSLISTSSGSPGTSTMVITKSVQVDQTPLASPVFDVSYILGGYRVLIKNSGLGYAIDNVITISGAAIGGLTPTNDLILTVNSIDSTGQITSVIRSGTPAGTVNNYYVRVVSDSELALYQNAILTVPVSGLALPYVGTISTTVTGIDSGTDELTLVDASDFSINDPVVFTGNLPATAAIALTAGATYYVTGITGNDITISETPGGTNINVVTTLSTDFTMAKVGSFAFLPEPFIFNQSIVKYNNRVYLCIVSNNDDEFVFGKWELLTSGDRRLNAMDRVVGYYEPQVNMPGRDLSQLFQGVIYPNSTYYGNQFQPSLQYPVDTVLQDQVFYPTEVEITSILWNGTNYYASANMPEYSSVISSLTGENWAINKLANTPIGTSDIIYAGGYYILTSTNSATPIFRSQDGITWTTNGFFTPWGVPPYDDTSWDMTSLTVSSLYLNSVAYKNGVWVAVGHNIVSSEDTFVWRERQVLPNGTLVNSLYGVDAVDAVSYSGFVAVGKGEEFDYSTGVTTTIDVSLIYISTNGIEWDKIPSVSSLGLYAVADNGSAIIAVGEDGIIYTSVNGTNWLGVTEVTVVSVNAALNFINLTSTAGFTVNDPIQFSQSFNVFTAGTTYYVKTVNSSTQITVSTTPGGATMVLTAVDPSTTTYMFAPRTATLRDVIFANSIYMAVGDSGLIRTSTNGYTWVTRTSGTTENLNGIMYNADDATWIACGDNNTIITSIDNGITWSNSSVFVPQTTIYDVQGNEFTFGYGPEELVPGVVTDNLMMTVATRPGTNWDETIYQHVGYNVVSLEYTPTSGTQTVYSFDVGNLYNVQSPAKLAVFVINGTTGLGTSIYQPAYSVNWVNNTITLATPLAYTPVADRLRINVYEVGNGNQLVKASTKTDPIRLNSVTGWNEIYVNCNYTGEIYDGSGVIRPNTFPVDVIATETDSTSNSILCESVKDFVLNDPIRFQGTTFGGILEDTTYYVKTISYITNRITISTTINIGTGTAGPTLALSNGTGSMNVIIKLGYGAPWTSPIIYHNGNKLLMGTTSTVTRTKASNNAITTNTTSGMILNEPIVFSDTMFGGVIVPQTTYYIKSIIDDNEFTVSATPGGATITLTNSTGGAEFITNDYAFGIAPNGITASIIFATGNYDASVDYISYTLFGETTPLQYGYTIPETQLITADGTTGPFSLTNYIGDDNPTNAIVEINGIRQTNTAYTINTITNAITFTSAPTLGATIAVTSYNLTDRQYFNTQYNITGKTVSKITNIDNAITPYADTTIVTNTTTGTNYITCLSTGNMSSGQTVVFKGASALGGIQVDGTVYFIDTVVNATTFTISATPGGATFALTTAAGSIIAYVGGLPAVRITTASVHNLTTNDFIRIDGVTGATQLNNNTYYVHVINSTQIDLYSEPYDPALNAVNDPITDISTYINGGYLWENNSYVIVTTTVTQTTTSPTLGNYLTVSDTSMLIEGTPIIFTGTSLGGVTLGETYYIRQVISATTFSIAETRYGEEFVLTNAVGSMDATQWEQENVDRIWVTVNGYRVPSSSLRLNPANEISILTEIEPSDSVIITSMMPSATPNEEVYLLNVNQTEDSSVYRANTQTRTWLTQALYNTDDTIFVSDVTRITDVVTQNNTVAAAVNGYYVIGLNADKRIISDIKVYNNTTGQFISNSNFELSIENIAPVLKITPGAYVSVGNSLTITILEGNLIFINGEQIKFSEVDLTANTISGLQRGANGTGAQEYIPIYSEVFGLISNNQLPIADYVNTWNSNTYNTTEGDPLQISTTESAIFLRGDIN